jgi:hypothetical protein
LKQQVRHLLSRHADVTHADIDLAVVEDVDEATAGERPRLLRLGPDPDGADGHDHLRLQLLDSTEIELEDVVCDSSLRASAEAGRPEDKTRVNA